MTHFVAKNSANLCAQASQIEKSVASAYERLEVPRDATIQQKLSEALSYLNELKNVQASLRASLFGEGEQGPEKEFGPVSIEGIASDLSRRAACLVGEAKTIAQRIA